jgi:hypothetical protein
LNLVSSPGRSGRSGSYPKSTEEPEPGLWLELGESLRPACHRVDGHGPRALRDPLVAALLASGEAAAQLKRAYDSVFKDRGSFAAPNFEVAYSRFCCPPRQDLVAYFSWRRFGRSVTKDRRLYSKPASGSPAGVP